MKARRRIRVLVVDDSATARRVVTEGLATDPALHVVGSAGSGEEALRLIRPLRPDVVILDIEMPVMDGLETLTRLRAEHTELPVIVFSASGPNAAERTLQALWLGATDYVPKPAAGGIAAALEEIREQLVWRIHAVAPLRRPVEGAAPEARPSGVARADEAGPVQDVSLVVIGASTGGPQALAVLLADLPADLEVPLVIVQHLPASFTSHLVAGLKRKCRLPIRIATDGAALEAQGVWIAPGDRHLEVERSGARLQLRLVDGPPINACRPSVDPLFRSAGELLGPRALAVVLTGMGQDGLEGCRRLRQAGGAVLAQDESSSVIWGMPGAVVRAGLADRVLNLRRIGPEIARRARGPGRRQARGRAA